MKSWFKKKFNRLRGKFSKTQLTTPDPIDPIELDVSIPARVHHYSDCLGHLVNKSKDHWATHQAYLDRPFLFNQDLNNPDQINLCMLDGKIGDDAVTIKVETDDSNVTKGRIYMVPVFEPTERSHSLKDLQQRLYYNRMMIFNTEGSEVLRPRFQINEDFLVECMKKITDKEAYNKLVIKKYKMDIYADKPIDIEYGYMPPNRLIWSNVSMCAKIMKCAKRRGYPARSFYYGVDKDLAIGVHMCYAGRFRTEMAQLGVDMRKSKDGTLEWHEIVTYDAAEQFGLRLGSLDVMAHVFEANDGILRDDEGYPRKFPKNLVS